ncbi:hypothetical protein ABKA04_006822 [Annulohypoxylon sp. FPYF3050]
MPILPTTKRISPTEWANRKPRIFELYVREGHTRDEVIEVMMREGFTATKSQYELQFKAWGWRKNRKQAEWIRTFQEQQQGEMAPITLAGRAISDSRIETARRRYAPGRSRALEPPDITDTALRGNDSAVQEHLTIPMEELASGAIMTTIQSHNSDQEMPLLGSASEDGVFSHENRDILDATDLVNFHVPATEDGTVCGDFPIESFAWNFPSDQIMDVGQPSPTATSWIPWPNSFDIDSLVSCDTTEMMSVYQWTEPLPSSQFTSRIIEARSLAENMFQAAIEADDVEVVKYLLDQTTLINANNNTIYYNGKKMTPLVKAASHRSFKIMKFLISRKVDVNRSPCGRSQMNALEMLVFDFQNFRLTLDDVVLEIVDSLLEAKTTISSFCMHRALQYTDVRLAKHLIKGSTIQQILKFILEDDILCKIIEILEKQDATSIVKALVRKFSKVDGGLFVEGSQYFESLLKSAVKRGYDEVVEILLPYSLYPGEILEIALGTRNRAMIELILQRYPDKEMECIEPLIAALKFRDRNHLRCLEESGLFNRLQGNRKLNVALITALEAGNSEYATKILDMDPDLESTEDGTGFDWTACFDAALAHNLDDIAWDNLSLGSTTTSDIKLLKVAITRRKLEFVKTIIELGLVYDYETGLDSFDRQERDPFNGIDDKDIDDISELPSPDNWLSVLETAIECGDDSILTYILQTNRTKISRIRPSVRLLDLALKKGRPGLLSNLVELGDTDDDEWKNEAAELAIARESILLLDILIGFGAKLDDTLLWRAVASHGAMIKPLLERYHKIYPKGRAKYGLDAVLKAIEKYAESPGLLDMLFASKLITVDILREHRKGKNPLCHAIEMECPVSLIKRLLDAGGDINYATWSSKYIKKTAFLDAIEEGNMELIELFIQYGADLNKPASFGITRTPLQKAVVVDNLEIVRLLLDKGADVNAPAPTLFGATALQLAAIEGNLEMVKLLVEHGAKFNVPPSRGRGGHWPLEGAALYGRLDMIMLLWRLNGGAFDNKQCQKAMRLAENWGHIGCRDLIKELMAGSLSIDGLDLTY